MKIKMHHIFMEYLFFFHSENMYILQQNFHKNELGEKPTFQSTSELGHLNIVGMFIEFIFFYHFSNDTIEEFL